MLVAEVDTSDIFLFFIFLCTILGVLAFIAWFGWRMTWQKVSLSPYTGLPLRYGREIGYYSAEQIYKYLFHMKQYDNRMFDLQNASFCRDTGRIFPRSVSFLDTINVDWGFLQNQNKGRYVTWVSLSSEQQKDLRSRHESLDRYQTEVFSINPLPKEVEPEVAYAKPGPLYVEIDTGVLLGWQIVPGTSFEVLILQKPIQIYTQKPL